MMSLLLNMPSRFVIVFLPSSKRLLISWLQSPSAVILEPKKQSQRETREPRGKLPSLQLSWETLEFLIGAHLGPR